MKWTPEDTVKKLVEEITELKAYRAAMPLERCAELAKVEQEGRLVVLPAIAGDTLYSIVGGTLREKQIIQLNMQFTKNIKHLSIITVNHRGANLCYEMKDIGKIVFLTREEAEKALESEGE